MSKDAETTFVSDWEGSAVGATTLSCSNRLMGAEDQEEAKTRGLGVIIGDGNLQSNRPPP